MPQRTYYYYYKRLETRIANEQKGKRREDILTEKEICKQRLAKALIGLARLADDDKVTPRVKMESLYRYAEVAVADFKLEAETGNWLEINKSLPNIREAIPISELTDEEWNEVAAGRTNVSEDVRGEHPPPE